MASRYLGHEMLVVGPGTKTGMAIRYDNPREIGADRLVNAVAIRERFGGPAVCVDFGTATTFDVVSREGEYLGGSLMTGIEISLEALSERGARLPKVDLAPPKSVIGKNTIDAIRSGVVFGYAGAIDAILRRLYDELGERTAVVATGGLARLVVPYTEEIEEVDDLLTLTGLRLLHERNSKLHKRTPIMGSMSPQLTDPWMLGPLRGAQPRAAGPAGRDRQLVRAPAGQALRRRDGGLGDGLLARDPLRQRADLHGDAADPPTRARLGGPVSIQLFGEDPAVMRSAAARVSAAGADAIDINMGCPVPKVLQDGRRRRAAGRSRPRCSRGARHAPRPGGLPVTVKLRSGRRPARRAALIWRIAWWRRPASPRSRSIPARLPSTTRAFPTTSSRRAWLPH